MKTLRALELITGMATGLLALVATVGVIRPKLGPDLVEVALYFGPAALVCTGSYLHTVQRQTKGFVMVLSKRL